MPAEQVHSFTIIGLRAAAAGPGGGAEPECLHRTGGLGRRGGCWNLPSGSPGPNGRMAAAAGLTTTTVARRRQPAAPSPSGGPCGPLGEGGWSSSWAAEGAARVLRGWPTAGGLPPGAQPGGPPGWGHRDWQGGPNGPGPLDYICQWKVASWYIPLYTGIYHRLNDIYHMVYTIWYILIYNMLYTIPKQYIT